jgi:hypothetical protein
MSETRKWYTEPESFVAIAALTVSLSALGVGVYEANLQRQHDRAEVWPHVEIELFADASGAKLQAENTGLGPAVVQSIEVILLGLPDASLPRPFWDRMKRIVVTICYRSVFGDHWIVRDTLGAARHWNDASDCPAQVPTADF